MSDSELGSFATTGSGKSEAEVAFELLNKLKGQGVWGERNVGGILDMYAECLDAAKGLRAYEGQKRVEVPIEGPVAEPVLQTQRHMPAPQQPPLVQTQPVQAQAVQAQPVQAQAPVQAQQPVQQQPVHVQQQVLQQAYKQG